MPTFLTLASFETRIISYLVIYLVSLMGMGYRQHFKKNNHAKSMQNFIQFFDSFSNKQEP